MIQMVRTEQKFLTVRREHSTSKAKFIVEEFDKQCYVEECFVFNQGLV